MSSKKKQRKRALQSPKKILKRKDCSDAEWQALLKEGVQLYNSGTPSSKVAKKLKISKSTIKDAAKRLKEGGSVFSTNKGGRPAFFSADDVEELIREDERRQEEHLATPEKERKKFMLEQHLKIQIDGYGSLGNVPITKILTTMSTSTLYNLSSKIWDTKLSNVKSDTLRRTEAKNDPYNPVNFIVMIRGLFGITKLSKKKLQQNGKVPPSNILNSDFSSVFVGKKLESETIMARRKLVREARNQGSNLRSTKLTRTAVCQPRSVNYMTITSGERCLALIFKTRDKSYKDAHGGNKLVQLTKFGGCHFCPIFIVKCGLQASPQEVAQVIMTDALQIVLREYALSLQEASRTILLGQEGAPAARTTKTAKKCSKSSDLATSIDDTFKSTLFYFYDGEVEQLNAIMKGLPSQIEGFQLVHVKSSGACSPTQQQGDCMLLMTMK